MADSNSAINPLRQFQADIARAAAQYPAQVQTWVAMRASGQGWLVAAAEMAEAMVAPPVSAIGAMPLGVLGIVAARGKVFTVLDMPRLLTGAIVNDEHAGWLVAVDPDFMPGVALWWPELVGMMPSTAFATGKTARAPLSRQVLVDAAGDTWQVLDVQATLDQVSRVAIPLAAADASILRQEAP